MSCQKAWQRKIQQSKEDNGYQSTKEKRAYCYLLAGHGRPHE